MKHGDPIHVGGGHLVHLYHPVAYLPEDSAVLWHTVEDGLVILGQDIRGHMTVQLVFDEKTFLRRHKKTMRYFGHEAGLKNLMETVKL